MEGLTRARSPPLELPDAERRQLSIMFCDMVGSTVLASRLDPEELQELMAEYHSRVAAAVAKVGGFVARYMGDGVLVYFGWPTADEADAERAVRAGLDVIREIGLTLIHGQRLQIRIGVATGLVVVGNVIGLGPTQEHAVVGETPNLAARLQSLAEPGTLVICPATLAQIRGLFDCEDLGPVNIKGFDLPISVSRVLRERALQSRFEALHTSELTPLVGRDEEVDILVRRWRQVRHGEGQVVLISGEPGIGKSRLVAALMQDLGDQDYACMRYCCSPYHRDSALYPIITQLEHAAAFGRDDTLEEKLSKLEAVLAPARPSEEDMALIADLLSLDANGRLPALTFSSQRKKEKTFDLLCRWLERLAGIRPVLMVLEDAHWADPTTRDLLDLMLDRIPAVPVLLVMTFRPEFDAPWIGQMNVTLLTLSRLGRREAAIVASQIDGASALPHEILDLVVAQADGVPLFIEELTKSIVESRLGTPEGAPAPTVPRTLQGSLMARLDRLPGAKQVAQVSAVIGREVSYELLAAVAPVREPALCDALDQLVASGLMFRRGQPTEAVYRFKHALVQDAAYGSLLRSSRSVIHAKIANALQQLVPDIELTQPELLGHHCARAGLIEKAVDYYRRAGEQSISRSAIAEARAHLGRGLELISSMSEGDERHALEARLLLALGSVSIIAEGYGGAELASMTESAVALSRRAGQRQLLSRALFGDWAYKVHIGDLAAALVVAEEMVALAELEGDPIVRIVAVTSLGINYAYGGRFVEAHSLFERCLAEPGIGAAAGLGRPHPYDHEVLARAFLSLTLACLGQGRESTREAQRSIERARSLSHHPSLAMALTMGCRQAWLMRDEQLVQERAKELVILSDEQGFPYWLARGRCYAGWAAVGQGRVEYGLALLRQALSHFEGTDVAMGSIAGFIGDAYARAGDLATALRYVDEALRVSATSGEIWTDAELHRLKGIILSAAPIFDAQSAEMHLLGAIGIAQSQSAKLWELRSTISLARFWLHHDKPAAALDLLASARGWFTEDRSVPDLREADALMRDLVDAADRVAGKGSGAVHVDAPAMMVTGRVAADPGGSM